MATAAKEPKSYKRMSDAERDTFRAKRHVEIDRKKAEEDAVTREHQQRLDAVPEDNLAAKMAPLSANDATRLTKWARTKLAAAGYNSVRNDSEQLASMRVEIMREMLAVDQRIGDIEDDGSDVGAED